MWDSKYGGGLGRVKAEVGGMGCSARRCAMAPAIIYHRRCTAGLCTPLPHLTAPGQSGTLLGCSGVAIVSALSLIDVWGPCCRKHRMKLAATGGIA